MHPAHRCVRVLAVLITALSAACDEDPGVEEVDRGAKPIEARRGDDESLQLAAETLDVARLELAVVHVVAEGTVGDTPIVVLADEDGALECAGMGGSDGVQWLDVDALAEGRLVPLHAPCTGVDADIAAVLVDALAR
jgi:hypothetical protein